MISIFLKNLVEAQRQTLLYNIKNDSRTKLAHKLSILYSGITDIELNEMTENLLSFYKIAVKAVLEQDNQVQNSETTYEP